MKNSIAIAIAILLLIPMGPVMAADAPYAGLQKRPVKALSTQQQNDLRAGRGMGMALAAELNNYPGPRHVLDLSEQLGLSAAQRSLVSGLFDEMSARAKPLGLRIVAAETRLDRLFAEKRVNDATLLAHTADIARLNGELRYVHLRYHLTVRELLTDTQIGRYAELRGYRSGGASSGSAPAGHPGHGGHR